MALNVITLMGNLTADPELKTSQSGANYCNFQIGVARSYVKQGEEKKADFIPIGTFGKTAEFVSKWFRKGSGIIVVGRLESDNYTDKDGNKRTSYKVVANEVSFAGSKKESEPTDNGVTFTEIENNDLPFSL